MPKTAKDLIYALADKVGGKKGQRMRAALEKPPLKGLKAWDEIMTDEEFSSQFGKMGNALIAKRKSRLESPGTWGQSN